MLEHTMQTILIRNGTIITANKISQKDVFIQDGHIVTTGHELDVPPDTEIVDAADLLVLPGLIDPHVHLREPGGEHKEDFASGTRAALAGGFTTVLAMPNTTPPLVDHESLAKIQAKAISKAACDVGFFVGATVDNAKEAACLKNVVGLKLYMGSSTGSLLVADLTEQIAHFERYPGVVAVHAEDEACVSHFAKLGQRRPPLCAALAVSRALALAKRFGTRLHICHISTAHELALIRDAKAHGVAVTCEVTPHHLFLSQKDEKRLGSLGQMNPPLRPLKDVETLWEHLDVIDCLATDHAPHTLEEKQGPKPPSGVPGLETALPLLSTAAQEGKLDWKAIVRLMAQGPASVFGLSGKGHIAPGYEANLVLLEADAEWIIGKHPLETKCAWSPFAGHKVRGRVKRVFLRGKEVYNRLEESRNGLGRRQPADQHA
jgi:dihydroorotase (multifunctional complex type)